VVLLTVYRRFRTLRDGWLTGLYFVLVFSSRFVLEYFKTPQADYEQGMAIHIGQYLSLPFVLLGIVLMARSRPATAASS
jgi:phosphatidylglycerol:prolipoprotein diacylglycerol transferase